MKKMLDVHMIYDSSYPEKLIKKGKEECFAELQQQLLKLVKEGGKFSFGKYIVIESKYDFFYGEKKTFSVYLPYKKLD